MGKSRRRNDGNGGGGGNPLPTMGEDMVGTIFNEYRNNNPGYVEVDGERFNIPYGTKKDLDTLLISQTLPTIRRNRLTGGALVRGGDPTSSANLHNLYNGDPYLQEVFPNYSQFEKYYDENISSFVTQRTYEAIERLKTTDSDVINLHQEFTDEL